jgi:hypothetical protein
MSTLPTPLRRQLETACKEARTIASIGARKALEALAVHEPGPYGHMDDVQCKLRRKLRDQARQLGDAESQTRRGAHEIKHLVEKLAYDQWHRLLFARFLLENNLLISPEHEVSVSMDDCEELAPSLGLKDAWAVAARFAATELPQIFRADDSAGAVEFAVEDRNPLVQLVIGLPVEVFTASDSLGWCYQFWQAERKNEVNDAGNKIGADELPAVTQLFTEDYMVDFLLDNTLGAWHAGKVLAARPMLAETAGSEEELRNAVALPGCPWRYLRFIKTAVGKWTPAAGAFEGWPKTARELKCLDPCMGSGHFVVAMFERLAALRAAEEKLDEAVAVEAVIRDNLFGLEIDPRCTQIAAFNLALAVWRRVGYLALPALNLACSGLAPNAKQEDWLRLAGDDNRLRNGMERLYRLFKDAPILGSLINPRAAEGDLLVAAFHELQPLLEKALSEEATEGTTHEMAVTARGLAKAAEILARQFTLVATNVPYLGRIRQSEVMTEFCERVYSDASADLATCFARRAIELCSGGCSVALVKPQNVLFLKTYAAFRRSLLKTVRCHLFAKLGAKAFNTPMWDFGVSLDVATNDPPSASSRMVGVDVGTQFNPDAKSAALVTGEFFIGPQFDQLKNPDAAIVFFEASDTEPLSKYADSLQGASTLDMERLCVFFWEVPVGGEWVPHQSTPTQSQMYSGLQFCSAHRDPGGVFDQLAEDLKKEGRLGGAWSGKPAWGKLGVACSWMGTLPAAVYLGQVYDNSIAAIIPKNPAHIVPIYCFCSSPQYLKEVRKLNQKTQVANATLVKVPFDFAFWHKVAAEKYPDGLPKPFSSDPTQWLFNGHPKGSDQPLHVAVARLLGFQWPRQTGSSFPDCPALGSDALERLADKDGIVCLSTTKGEAPADERLRAILVHALGQFDLKAMIGSAGPKGSGSETLEEWLRNEFFEQHCALFQHRPFVWHIWDGHRNGFSVLVNYHKLTYANLENLTYAYLGDWIRRQQAAKDSGEAGSDLRLQAAKQLQARLKLILEGEPPYDLFVRWKPLSRQAIGWHPDINDGVRINIRPFATADILRKRVKIKWDKDRGKEPVRGKKDFPWFWGWDEETQDFAGAGTEPDSNRWSDCHYTNEFKKSAREANRPR